MGKQAKQTVPVGVRAIVQRVNRVLQPKKQSLKVSRGERCKQELGAYYVVDFQQNSVRRVNVDLAELARELGVLAAWEDVADG
jgi:hypothetical protein